jgi:hypothetical protein
MIDAQLLGTIADRDAYDKYASYVKGQAVLQETGQIVKDMGEWFKANPEAEEIDWPAFTAWSRVTLHPTWKREQAEVYERVCTTAQGAVRDEAVAQRFITLRYADDIVAKAGEVKAGLAPFAELAALVEEYDNAVHKTTKTSCFVDNDLTALLATVLKDGGLEWRLEDLNRSVGPVHKGDLVIVGKRPEVGGTTFITSEFTYMVSQLPEGQHAIIFNNEETGSKIGLRLIQSALGLTVWDVAADPTKSEQNYHQFLGTRRIDVYHDTGFSTRDVERVLRSNEYGLVAFNILDKVRGFHKLEGVERLRALAVWARGIADKHGVVMAVAQADASAEGQKWLDQSQLYGSKTGMQGEADVLLMIGKDPVVDDERYISIAKNKTPGGSRTDRNLRHGRLTVGFDGEVGQFNSIVYTDRGN